VLPVYRSQQTLGRCLRCLREQTLPHHVVVVDSSPDDTCAELVRRDHPEVDFVRSTARLLPHAARNLGARRTQAELLVFSDPDVYAPPGWLAALVDAHDASGGVVVGALACHGRRWLDRGTHLVKFSKWLPGGPPRDVDMSPTANMLLPRALFEELGGFDGERMLADTSFSWELRRRGHRLRFAPRAVVEHHHVDTARALLGERYRRGIEYGDLRLTGGEGTSAVPLARLLAVPPRVLSNVWLTARHATAAGQTAWLLATLPVVAAGHVTALAGEAVSYWRAARRAVPFAARAARSR
jgi:GT2 family glycosyltransferase